MSGWGKDAFTSGSYQHVLKEVELPILSHNQCENMLRRTRLGPSFILHEGFICAGGEEGKYFFENMLRRTRLGPSFILHEGFICAGGEEGKYFFSGLTMIFPVLSGSFPGSDLFPTASWICSKL